MRAHAFAFVASLAVAAPAHAFCGFFVAGSDAKLTNNASQVVLLRKGNRTVMTMSNNYKGPPEDFAMVVPVPVVLHKEDVKTLPADVFDHIDSLSAPRLVEYWEQDPCMVRRYEREDRAGAVGGAARRSRSRSGAARGSPLHFDPCGPFECSPWRRRTSSARARRARAPRRRRSGCCTCSGAATSPGPPSPWR